MVLATAAGARQPDAASAVDIPEEAVVKAWRMRANPVYARVVLPPRYPYADVISRVSARFGLPADLIAGVVYVESRFNPRCVSHRGAVGLMQLLPSTARPLARKLGFKRYNLFDPETNLILGAYFLKDRIRAYGGDLAMALSYYNGGRWGIVSRGKFRNRGYIRSVMQHYRRFDGDSTTLFAAIPNPRALDGRNTVSAQ
jgi:soluble lytic murein transglycosylase-like protein